MNVLIAGGTGFVGKHLVRAFADTGHGIILARRPGSKAQTPEEKYVRVIDLDPRQGMAAEEIAADAIINLVGIIREFPSRGITFHKAHFEVTRNLVDFARKIGIPRFLQMSALGVKPDAESSYMRTKYDGECYVQESGLHWTIYRPSVIFGPGDHVVTLFNSLIRRFPVIGVVGDGQYKLQPVHVRDVCAGFVRALTDERARSHIFEFGGPEIMTFNRMLDLIGEVIGITPVRKVHMPVGLFKTVSSVLMRFPQYPISPEQIDMLVKGNSTEDNSYYDFVERIPISFKEGISEYLASDK